MMLSHLSLYYELVHGGFVSEALEVISKMEAYGIEMGMRH